MSIDLEITLQDAKLIAGLLRAAGAQKQVTSEIDKTKKESIKAEKELDRMAEAVKRITATPLEKYNKELAKLDTLQQKNKITATDYTRAVALQKAELDKATAAAQKLSVATDKAGAGGSLSVLEIASSLGIVTNVAGVATAAVNQITDALRRSREEARAAAADMDGLFGSRRTLNQVADSPADMQQMLRRVDAGASKYGVGRDVATDIMADAKGSGFTKDYEFLLSANAGGINAREAARMAKKVLPIFGGKDRGLNAQNATDMALAAAKPSELSFEDLASGIAQASEGGSLVGSNYEETVAALSVMGGKFASVQTAADRLKGFGARAGIDDRLKGKGFIGAMRTLRDDFSAEDRKGFLGDSQELNVMYQMLAENEGAVVARQGAVAAARGASDAGRGEVSQALARAAAVPELAAVVQKDRAQRALEVQREGALGVFGQAQEAGLAVAQQRQLQVGNGWLRRGLGNTAAQAAAVGGVPGQALPAVSAAGGFGGEKYLLSLFAGPLAPFAVAASLLKDAATELKKSAKRPLHAAAQIEANQPHN